MRGTIRILLLWLLAAPETTIVPVRVGINARLLASPDIRGFNRYTAELVRALAATSRVDLVLFSDAPIHRRHGLDALPAVIGTVRPQLRWQHGWLPGALKAERIELFHAPAHWGVPWRSACPVVVTIHDVADRELPALQPPTSVVAALRHEGEQWLAVRRARPRPSTLHRCPPTSTRRARRSACADRTSCTSAGSTRARTWRRLSPPWRR